MNSSSVVKLFFRCVLVELPKRLEFRRRLQDELQIARLATFAPPTKKRNEVPLRADGLNRCEHPKQQVLQSDFSIAESKVETVHQGGWPLDLPIFLRCAWILEGLFDVLPESSGFLGPIDFKKCHFVHRFRSASSSFSRRFHLLAALRPALLAALRPALLLHGGRTWTRRSSGVRWEQLDDSSLR